MLFKTHEARSNDQKGSPKRVLQRTGERSMRDMLTKTSLLALMGLAASLAFALTRYKQLHIVTGWVFVASVVVHMAVFRRTLLK